MGVQIVSASFAGADREPAHREIMHQVAVTIATTYTEQLIDLLTSWSFDIWSVECCEKLAPTRVEARRTLLKLLRCFSDSSEILRISQVASSFANFPQGTETFQQALALLTQKALNSPAFVAQNGKVYRGAGKAHPSGYTPSKAQCAAIISEIWSFYHNAEYPAATNKDAGRAAQLFYHSHNATGETNSWGAPENGWSRHFNKIDHPNLVSVRKEVRRLLAIVHLRHTEHN